MNKLIVLIMTAFISVISFAKSDTITDIYDITFKVKTPQIVDNMQSLGKRVYKMHTIKGQLYIIYRDGVADELIVTNLVNKSYKVSTGYVKYTSNISDTVFPRLSYVGDNKKDVFKTPNIVFYLEADPSYNIGAVDEDNSLYILCSGIGQSSTSKIKGCRIISKLTGYLTGNLGCGCYAYGHVSPTRLVGPCGHTDNVTDVAAVLGTWSAKWKTRTCCK